MTTSRIRALLGPTNTGKTHRAVQTMLAHRSGMIGLPLRLLAREVYDRIAAEKGPDQVALVTGEEKLVPKDPRWFVCTVEAMPLDRRVAFLAVDEVQLAGDRNRGHTFTDRILHARGTLETWFMGAPTIATLLRQLVPDVEIDGAPRLSTLTYAGERKLTSLPSRSAVVAFSAEQVYAHAERLRSVHGGAAVVLGALSPRTRNAQVALYQSGEVGHLVATDAIGMGLNMDVEHVAFSALRKFDGRGFRNLSAAEVGQIAGRAGRYKTDGTFGTTAGLGPMDDDVVDAVQRHQFAPLTKLYWRNAQLDFDDPDALLHALGRRPSHAFLIPCRHEDDQKALEDLLVQEPIRARLGSSEALQRLWSVCQVPDYRKDMTGAHARLLGELAIHRMEDAPIPVDLVSERLDRLDRTDGDLDTLMARIAWIRTWTYVSHQRGWTEDPKGLQTRARDIEDRLSDALHAQLIQRFVDRRLLLASGDAGQLEARLDIDDDEVHAGSLQLGRIEDLSFVPATGVTAKRVLAAVRRALRSEALRRVGALEALADDGITIDSDGYVTALGQRWARLTPSEELLRPGLKLLRLDLLQPPGRDRVRDRLRHWLARYADDLFRPLERGPAKQLGPAGKGVVHQLRQGLGTADVDDLVTLPQLTEEERRALARLDVRIGTATVYVQTLLRGPALERKAVLWSLHHHQKPLLEPPANGPTSVPVEGANARFLAGLGYREVGQRLARVDMLERVLAKARSWAKSREPVDPAPVLGWLGCSHDDAVVALESLGFRVMVEAPDRIHVAKGARRRPPGRRRGRRR